jgi:hypothetical protein
MRGGALSTRDASNRHGGVGPSTRNVPGPRVRAEVRYAARLHEAPSPKRASRLTVAGVGCLLAVLGITIAGWSAWVTFRAWILGRTEVTYMAAGDACPHDIVYLDGDGDEVRLEAVRGGRPGGLLDWTKTFRLRGGAPFRIEVVADASCARVPFCTVTHDGELPARLPSPRRTPDGRNAIVCEGVTPPTRFFHWP